MGRSKEDAVKSDKRATLIKHLGKIRINIHYMDDLVTELEVPQDYKGPHYEEFCQSYTKALILLYCHSLDDAELLLASYGLLPKLERTNIKKLTARRTTYYQLAHGYNTLLSTWGGGSIDKMVRYEEDRIIAYLADDLVKALSPKDGKLHFKEQLSKDSELFTPRYLHAVEDDPIDAPPESLAVLALAEVADSENSAGKNKPVGVGNDESMGNSPVSAIANSSTNDLVKENDSRQSNGGKGYQLDRQIKNINKDTDGTDEDKLQENRRKRPLWDFLITPIIPLPLYIIIAIQAIQNVLLLVAMVVLVLVPQLQNTPSERPNKDDYVPPAVSDSSYATVNDEMVEPSLFNP